MSLESLRRLRRGGHRPKVVTVLVGKPPAWFEDSPAAVIVEKPPADLSPLVGLEVEIIELARDDALMVATMQAVEDAGAKTMGVCGSAGACGVSEQHERLMLRYREALCLTT